MMIVSEDLRPLFKSIPHLYFNLDGKKVRADKLTYATFCKDNPLEIDEGDVDSDVWEIMHLDGNPANNEVSNLQLIIFRPLEYIESQYESAKKAELEKQAVINTKNELKTIQSDNMILNEKIKNLNGQLEYEKNRNLELNKELKDQNKEIRRLYNIIESYNKR